MIDHVDRAKGLNAGMVYVTDDMFQPNPFDDLASYWTMEVQQATIPEPATPPLLLLLGGITGRRSKRSRR